MTAKCSSRELQVMCRGLVGDMKRRDFLTALKSMVLTVCGGCFFTGCQFIESKAYNGGQFAYYLGYLLYGHNPPLQEVARIAECMRGAAQEYAGLQSRYERIYFDIVMQTWPASFQHLSAEQQRNVFKKIMPTLLLHQEIADVINAYMDAGWATVLYYPDMIGSYGECGWLVLEGAVWDRYYGK